MLPHRVCLLSFVVVCCRLRPPVPFCFSLSTIQFPVRTSDHLLFTRNLLSAHTIIHATRETMKTFGVDDENAAVKHATRSCEHVREDLADCVLESDCVRVVSIVTLSLLVRVVEMR